MDSRRLVQWTSTLAHNAYVYGFARLKIYQGIGKGICVPVLNCYSCPGAIGSCPVGSIQASLASFGHRISLYVVGIVTLVGVLAGRWVCGWLCPFGLFQELLGGISKNKKSIPAALTLLKYPILILTILLPVLWVNADGVGGAYYCRLICPAGTLEAGLPMGLGRSDLRALLGVTFLWKVFVLTAISTACLFYFRPFCRTLCPLGAFYGLFNPVSIWRLERKDGCISCGKCQAVCQVNVDVMKEPNSPECIRCLRCSHACPEAVLHFSGRIQKMPAKDPEDSDNVKTYCEQSLQSNRIIN